MRLIDRADSRYFCNTPLRTAQILGECDCCVHRLFRTKYRIVAEQDTPQSGCGALKAEVLRQSRVDGWVFVMKLSKSLTSVALAGSMVVGATAAMADGYGRGSIKDAPYVAPFSWTGFYAGVNVGAAWVQSDVTLTSNPVFFGPAGVGGPDGPASLDRDGSARFRDTVFTGGGQIGANWQTGSLVFGIEADINSVRFSNSADSGVRPTPPLSPGLGTYRFIESVDGEWLATARARLGYAMDRTLIYVTGGAAWAKFDFTQQSGPFSGCGGGPLCTVTSSASGTKTGWAIGGGFEYAFTNNWTFKGEYLHADLGSVSFADNLAAGGFPAASFTHKADLTMDLARVGINYKF